MLVCPQCQFENPHTNKFCQECGSSLTEKACPTCGMIVSLSDQRCLKCGTVTGTLWWAILSNPLDQTRQSDYLDVDRRYQILEPLPDAPSAVKVLDLQPLQLSPLETLIAPVEDISEPQAVDPSAEALRSVIISPQVQLYLDVRSQINQTIPQVHDAWKTEHQEVLLVEDRSSLPSLATYLKSQSAIPLLQILHWFHEMLDIWDALEPYHARQSLLDLQNLRLDEDQALCLQWLSGESEPAPNLQNLGGVWQFLLEQLSQTQSAALHLLVVDLQVGKLETTDVRSRLETIAHDFQISLTQTETMPDPQEFSPDDTTLPLSSDEDGDDDFVQAVTLPPDVEEDSDGDDMPTIVLPMQLFSLDDAGRTDIGRQRDHNEDCFCINTRVMKAQLPGGKTVRARGLYVLCDGMGGHASGEVASQLAVDTLREFFQDFWENDATGLPSKSVIQEAVQLANKAIFDVNQQNARSGSGRMGTTMVMMLLHDTEIAVAHVGDSRLYRYTRKRQLEQITLDHEVGQREIQRGVEKEIAYGRPDAYQLTQALGPRDEHFINPDIQFLELNEDTLIILASDGLTDNDLLEKHKLTHLDPFISSQASLEQGVGQLIDLANEYNGHDNITAVVIRAKVRPNLDHLK
ncbi:serine/threonine phosphatase [Phormidesmis sp. 146-12]